MRARASGAGLQSMVASVAVLSTPQVQVTVGGPVNVEALTRMVNEAYKVGERDIIVDTKANPFARWTTEDVNGLLDTDSLLLARAAAGPDAGEVLGCVKVDFGVSQVGLAAGDRLGEWGGLAVASGAQGHGLGSVLVAAAERHLQASGCTLAELELLAPSAWEHAHKERLRNWYVERLGYDLKVHDDYKASTMSLPQGTLLLDRFELATASDFTVYRRRLTNLSTP